MSTASLRVPSFPVFSLLSQIGFNTALLLSRMSTRNRLSDVDPVAESGPIDWHAVDSSYSSDEMKALQVGWLIQTLPEKRL